jgi:hypothetical protein
LTGGNDNSRNDVNAFATLLKFDTNKVAEFLTHLTVCFSEAGEFTMQLPEILQEVGKFIGVQQITMSFQLCHLPTLIISECHHSVDDLTACLDLPVVGLGLECIGVGLPRCERCSY